VHAYFLKIQVNNGSFMFSLQSDSDNILCEPHSAMKNVFTFLFPYSQHLIWFSWTKTCYEVKRDEGIGMFLFDDAGASFTERNSSSSDTVLRSEISRILLQQNASKSQSLVSKRHISGMSAGVHGMREIQHQQQI
jgi:hypothetical protein